MEPTKTQTPTPTSPLDEQDAQAEADAPPDWQAFVPTDTADHLATMDRAARESGCGVPWHLLAAISRVESDFGRNMATSSAGAVGYGQFLSSSWQAFGNAGNVYDYRDALPAIATYLCQSGLATDPRAALFAYNHADWYVDMVLDLAVRYDRLAPGAPTPDVLAVGPAPAVEAVTPIHYAAGRDIRLQTRARTAASGVWLGVPWRGRTPGVALSTTTLETTALAMVRAGFGLSGGVAQPIDTPEGALARLGDRAWESGLLPVPIELPVYLQAPDEQAMLAEVRRRLQEGQPLVALLDAQSLPGHPAGEAARDQPVVVVGETSDGLVYSDPSFSSTLGYGLELSNAEFLKAWESAATPLQALAFAPRPRMLSRQSHLLPAEPPPVIARVLPTPPPPPAPAGAADTSPLEPNTAPPSETQTTPPTQLNQPTPATPASAADRATPPSPADPTEPARAAGPPEPAGAATPANAAGRATSVGVDEQAESAEPAAAEGRTGGGVRGAAEDDRSWMPVFAAGGFLAAAFGFRWWRARSAA